MGALILARARRMCKRTAPSSCTVCVVEVGAQPLRPKRAHIGRSRSTAPPLTAVRVLQVPPPRHAGRSSGIRAAR